MKNLSTLFFTFFITFLSVSQHSNEFYNKGALVTIQSGAEVHVLGDVHMVGSTATLFNNGLIKTQGNSYSDNLFQQRGTGTYQIENSDVNTGERQFISGSYAVRGGQSNTGVNDGSFYNLELANDQGIVYLVSTANSNIGGENLVADVRNTVDFKIGSVVNNSLITNDVGMTGAIIYPANGSSYSSVFGMMNSTAGLGNFIDNTISTNGNLSGTDNSYIQGKLRRAISSSGGQYGFVFGVEPAAPTAQKGVQYMHLDFDFNSYDVITGYFESASPNIGTDVGECSGNLINYWGGADHGEWMFNDISGSGSGDYEVRVWPQDYNYILSPVWVITKNNAISGTANTCGPTPIGLTRGGFNGFDSPSEFNLAAPISALPIELIDISAQGINDHISVKWNVASESNFSHYELERSEDANNFYHINSIPSQGNTQSEMSYDYMDEDLRFFTNYFYRLKSVDLNGSYEYSPIVSASIENRSLDISLDNVGVYPNPSISDFKIAIKAKEDFNLELKVINSLGKMISRKDLSIVKGSTVIILEAQDWAAGIYFIEFTNLDTKSKFTKRIIKE